MIPIPGSPFSPASPGTPGTPRSPWQRDPPEKVHTAKLNKLGLSESEQLFWFKMNLLSQQHHTIFSHYL